LEFEIFFEDLRLGNRVCMIESHSGFTDTDGLFLFPVHFSACSSDKDEPDSEAVSSMLGFQSYWDAAYADELTNFREHGHTGEVW